MWRFGSFSLLCRFFSPEDYLTEISVRPVFLFLTVLELYNRLLAFHHCRGFPDKPLLFGFSKDRCLTFTSTYSVSTIFLGLFSEICYKHQRVLKLSSPHWQRHRSARLHFYLGVDIPLPCRMFQSLPPPSLDATMGDAFSHCAQMQSTLFHSKSKLMKTL